MSWLLDATINKVLKKVFNGIAPKTITDIDQQLMFMQKLYGQINEDADFKMEKEYFYVHYSTKKKIPNITLKVKSLTATIYAPDLRINFSDSGDLQINNDGKKYFYFNDFDDLLRLKTAFQKEYELVAERNKKSEQNEVKRDKIKQIKTKAILAKINEIAEEEGFEHFVDAKLTTKVKLYIRLAKNDYVELDIPYKNFQDVLQNAREVYHSIKKLKDDGIQVKMKYSIYTKKMKWKTLSKNN